MEALIYRNITKTLCPSEECDKFQVRSLCSSSSKLFVYFQFQFQFQAQLVKTPQPVGFVVFSHMSYASSKGALNCIRRVTLGKPQIGSMEALIFHRNITKNCPSEECDKFKVISSCSSSSKLFVYFQFQFQFQAQLVKTPQPVGFVVFSHMSYASSKGALNCIRRVTLGKPQIGSMEALIFHRNIKTFALQTNVTSSR